MMLKTLATISFTIALGVSCSNESEKKAAEQVNAKEESTPQETTETTIEEVVEAETTTAGEEAKAAPIAAARILKPKKSENKFSNKKTVDNAIVPAGPGTTMADEVKITQSAPISSTAVSSGSASTKRSKMSASMTVTGVSDFKETTDASKSTYSQYQLSLGYRVDEVNSVSLSLPMQKDLSREFEESFFLDARLLHTRKNIYRYGLMDFHHTTAFVYPTTESTKVRDEMYWGFELSPRLDFTLNKYVKGLKLTYIPRYRRRFHKFTTNRAGEFIVNESLLQFFVGNWAFAKDFAYESTLIYVMNRRYDGVQTDDSYLTVQELQYSFTSDVTMLVGIQTGGSLLNPERGQSKTIEIFDENLSEFYTGASVAF